MPAQTAGAIRFGRAFVELFADDSKLAKGLKEAEKTVREFGKHVSEFGKKTAEVGAAIVAPLAAAAKLTGTMGAELIKTSDQTGIAVEALSSLGFAATQSGSDVETFQHSIRHMQESLVQGVEGSDDVIRVLQSLGLSLTSLAQLKPDQQFKAFADRIAQIRDPAVRTAFAMQIFGKSGADLLPMLRLGADGIENLQKQATTLGVVISRQDAVAADAFNNKLGAMWAVLKAGAFTIGSALIPTLTDLATRVMQVSSQTAQWVSTHRAVVVSLVQVGAAVAATGAAIYVLGKAVKVLSFGLLVARTSVLAFGVALKLGLGVASAVVTILTTGFSVIATTIGLLLNPIGLVVAAIAGLGAYFVYQSGAITGAVGAIREAVTAIARDFKTTYLTMVHAIGAGDLQGAVKAVWATIKLEWARGINVLNNMWTNAKFFFIETWHGAVYQVTSAFASIGETLGRTWSTTLGVMEDLWDAVWPRIYKVASTAIRNIALTMVQLHGKAAGTPKAEIDAQATAIFEDAARSQETYEQQRQRERELRNSLPADSRTAATDLQSPARLAEIERAKQITTDALARDRQLAANDAELIEAQHKFNEAMFSINAAAFAAKQKAGAPPVAGSKDVSGGILGLFKNFSVAGTFNAFAVRGLGGASLEEQILEQNKQQNNNQKQANKLLQQIVRHKDTPLLFAKD